jgi:hypothetical protein
MFTITASMIKNSHLPAKIGSQGIDIDTKISRSQQNFKTSNANDCLIRIIADTKNFPCRGEYTLFEIENRDTSTGKVWITFSRAQFTMSALQRIY